MGGSQQLIRWRVRDEYGDGMVSGWEPTTNKVEGGSMETGW